jgi:hypothetical protein
MRQKYALLAIIAVILIALAWFARSIQYCGWDFHLALYGPVNMLLHGSTPYTLNAPYGPFPSTWMPQIMGAFFWIGLLPCTVSSSLWTLVEVCGFIWLIWLFNEYKNPPRWIFITGLLALFLFPSLWVHVILGQFSMLFTLLMIVVVFVPGARRWTPLILALGLAKPQLGILIYPGLVVYTWRTRGFRAALWLMVSTALCVAALTIPLFIFYPNWFGDFLFITVDNLNKHWNLPSLFLQLPLLIGPAGTVIWALLLLASLGLTLRLWYSQDKKTALLVSLALTPMITTYTSSWDFMLLLPAFYWLLFKLKNKAALAVLLSGMVLVYALQYAARWHTDIADARQWWITPAMNGVFLAAWLIEVLSKVYLARRQAVYE